jgi:hypothetical protein
MVTNRPTCHVIMYSQKESSRDGPVGNLACARVAPYSALLSDAHTATYPHIGRLERAVA